MGDKVSEVDADDVKQVIEFVLASEKDSYSNPMFPWHIARALRNRLEKKRSNTSSITVNNSHMRMITKGISRMYEEQNIDEETKDSIKRLHSKVTVTD